MRTRRQGRDGSVEPEVAVELALCSADSIDERIERLADAERGREDLVALADERLEEAVARGEAITLLTYGCLPGTPGVGATETPLDGDGDRIADPCDNCPAIRNALPEDCDGNGIGNVCVCGEVPAGTAGEVASDTDGFPDGCDNCLGADNWDQADCNFDAITDLNARRVMAGMPPLDRLDRCSRGTRSPGRGK